jgi:hypothetical protein
MEARIRGSRRRRGLSCKAGMFYRLHALDLPAVRQRSLLDSHSGQDVGLASKRRG